MFFSILHFILGYVHIRVEDGFHERFINLCTAYGIPLWNIQKHDGTVTACTTAHGYLKIREPARKSGTRVHITTKTGLPFLINRNRSRVGILIGIAVSFAVLGVLSGYIWVIDVEGNETVSDSEIIAAFAENGLKIGCRASGINKVELQINALAKLDGISWASVNIDGSAAVIEVHEAMDTPEIEERRSTGNIIASKDGQVEIVEPYRGSAAVKPGATVTEGSLLISGAVETRTQSALFTDASGYVVAATTIDTVVTQGTTQTVVVPKVKRVYYLSILGKEIPLGKKNNCAMCFTSKKMMQIADTTLPFGIVCRTCTDFTEKSQKQSAAESRLTAMNSYGLKSYQDTLHAQIIRSDTTISESAFGETVCGKYFCYENIAEFRPFSVEENAEELQENEE